MEINQMRKYKYHNKVEEYNIINFTQNNKLVKNLQEFQTLQKNNFLNTFKNHQNFFKISNIIKDIKFPNLISEKERTEINSILKMLHKSDNNNYPKIKHYAKNLYKFYFNESNNENEENEKNNENKICKEKYFKIKEKYIKFYKEIYNFYTNVKSKNQKDLFFNDLYILLEILFKILFNKIEIFEKKLENLIDINYCNNNREEKKINFYKNEIVYSFFYTNIFKDKEFLFILDNIKNIYDLVESKYFNFFYADFFLRINNNKNDIDKLNIGKSALKNFEKFSFLSKNFKFILLEENSINLFVLMKFKLKDLSRLYENLEKFDNLILSYFSTNSLNFSEINILKKNYESIDSKIIDLNSLLNFMITHKFYNYKITNNDFNSVFDNISANLDYLIYNLIDEFVIFLKEIFIILEDPLSNFNKIPIILNKIKRNNLIIMTKELKKFIYNHIISTYLNDNNFEIINRNIWLEKILIIYAMSNFTESLLDIIYLINKLIIKNDIDCFINNNDNDYKYKDLNEYDKDILKILNKENIKKAISHKINKIFYNISLLMPKRILIIREIYTIINLTLLLFFFENCKSYISCIKENNRIFEFLNYFKNFQNKYYFFISNSLLKYYCNEKVNNDTKKLRIYYNVNNPLEFFEYEDSYSYNFDSNDDNNEVEIFKFNFKELFIHFDMDQLKLFKKENKNIFFYIEKENLKYSIFEFSSLSQMDENINKEFKIYIKSFSAKSFIVFEMKSLNNNNSGFYDYYDDNFTKIFNDFKKFEIYSKLDMEYLLMVDYEELEGISRENFNKNFIFYDNNKKLGWDEFIKNLDNFLS
jgi:hypothetical protein